MARTWGDLRRLYLSACKNQQAARTEAWDNLGEAHRLVSARLDLPELAEIDESVTVASGNDYVTMATVGFSVFAVFTVFNVTDGIIMRPEPSGMIGREALLEKTTGKPASGTLTHYQRDGVRLYVRGTAAANTQLRVRGKKRASDLSESDIANAPTTTPEYDRAIVAKAAELFFLLHGDENTADAKGRTLSDKFGEAFNSLLPLPESPRVAENLPRTEVIRLSGYNMSPRSARRR